ncbi:hypothetical protein CALCODRAFT_112275 [Calocera cornea HHB12733]|uniref:Uncharacterized protein n=1 Tax=Calocera cornea HHB12733 TaxID=1353952 RepID=A0A165D124_9BASI|nr:hypothetical protein CALCODRAFT_112275 [Calocera cornea HHB12733]
MTCCRDASEQPLSYPARHRPHQHPSRGDVIAHIINHIPASPDRLRQSPRHPRPGDSGQPCRLAGAPHLPTSKLRSPSAIPRNLHVSDHRSGPSGCCGPCFQRRHPKPNSLPC